MRPYDSLVSRTAVTSASKSDRPPDRHCLPRTRLQPDCEERAMSTGCRRHLRAVVWLLALVLLTVNTVEAGTTYTALPLAFEPNRGQADASVRFLSRGAGYALFLTSDEAILALRGAADDVSLLRMTLAG